jgi:hypothetical protein
VSGTTAARVLDEVEFRRALVDAAADYSYATFSHAVVVSDTVPVMVPHDRSTVRFLPFKHRWYLVEFLPFEGEDFVCAVYRSLRGRMPTPSELGSISGEETPWDKLSLILELNRRNRNEGIGVRVTDVRVATMIWLVVNKLKSMRLPVLSGLADRAYRLFAVTLFGRMSPAFTMQRILYQSLDLQDVAARRSGRR